MECEERKTSEQCLHLRNRRRKGPLKGVENNQPEKQEEKNQENRKSWKPKQESTLKRKEWSTVSNTAKRLDKRISEKCPLDLTMEAMRRATKLQ